MTLLDAIKNVNPTKNIKVLVMENGVLSYALGTDLFGLKVYDIIQQYKFYHDWIVSKNKENKYGLTITIKPGGR
ncbi:hypothetical protein [Vagococcus fessus]|uniref:Uncharacterized protein n=1 Tax=Vagococcus fessus TaxID=120370 RepID=A0A430A569_9ENTE|nr:hypothetical protein [Vagococcus fessus]RSU01939.1 hypothetical protein CBF31_09225 [Vagococcus fessus]